MPPLFLITRPQEDAAELAAELENLGARSIAVAIQEAVPDTQTISALTSKFIENPSRYAAILATSKNAVRAAASIPAIQHLPLLSVGDGTARLARDLGWEQVESAGGDVHALAGLVARRFSSVSKPLLYFSGKEISADLPSLLSAQNITCERHSLYAMQPVPALPDIVLEMLNKNNFTAAIFYSAASARHFNHLVQQNGPNPNLSGLIAYCLSARIAAALASHTWQQVISAPHPTTASLLECITANIIQPLHAK